MPAILSRAPLSVKAQAQRPQVPAKPAVKPQAPRFAPAAAAAFAALSLAVAPAFAEVNEAELKKIVCASNPTAKICLQNSAKE